VAKFVIAQQLVDKKENLLYRKAVSLIGVFANITK
jgi:hypothetical protein